MRPPSPETQMNSHMPAMGRSPEIPYGYKRVTGQAQKGDGIWDGTRFRKVKKQYPFAIEAALTLARNLNAEFVVEHRAGGTEVSDEYLSDEDSFRACEHPKLAESQYRMSMEPPPADGFGAFDGEPYAGNGTFATGPEFGCVHHEP